MYYVKTETEKYTITSSYITEKQARRYGGEPVEQDLHLMDDGFTAQIVEFDEDLKDIGTVRTIFHSRLDGKEAGRFLLYLQDEDNDWYYTGISFHSYSDANQAVKGALSTTFGDMLILEVDAITPTSKEEYKLA